TGVAWTPDGRMLIIEKDGRLRVQNPGATAAPIVLDITTRVNQYHDRGLLGIAVDSSFATNHYIYLLYTNELNPLAQDNSGQMVSRLGRFVLNNDNTVGPETVLLGSYGSGVCPTPSNTVDCIPSEGFSHSIGSVRSAPDGTLYVGSGDASSYDFVDPMALRTYDERSFAGKIMHIDRNGRGLGGHAFCPTDTDTTHVCTKLFAKGLRNPYRFKLRPNGGLTVGDVGWNTREELDLIDPGEVGQSWGWPCYEGSIQTPGYSDRSECQAEYRKPAGTHSPPDYDYEHTGGNAILGGPLYQGDQYPTGYRGTIFFGDYAAGWLKRATIDSQNHITGVSDFATDWYGTDIETAPDGNIVWVSFGDGSPGTGSVEKVVYTNGNRAPIPSATADKTSGPAPLTVKFDATGSRDPDGDAMTYDWDFGDGSAHATSATPSHTYATGNWTARLTVTDARGRSASTTLAISAGNSAPVVTIAQPTDGGAYTDNVPVPLVGSATDTQDGTLPGSAITWHMVLHHGNHTHPVNDVTGTSATFTPYDDHDADSYYDVTMTARDSSSLTGSRTITIKPRTIKLSAASTPAGAPITYSGLTAQPAPWTRDAAINYHTTISAADQFTAADGKTYVFDSWSDGGARSHDLTVPAASATLTAVYKAAAAPPPVAGLVGAWGFNEGSGTVANDASGKGNTGTLGGGPTWTTGGRFGGALTFDGVNDWVTVPDSSSLDLTGPMTLEAWVRPRALTAWNTVLMKEFGTYYAYALYATDDSLVPTGWARDAVAWGTSPLPVGSWSHLAFTYDGTITRLYVDGVLKSSMSQPFTLPNTNGPLRMGGNGIWGEWFNGQLDDVRVYNRPLSPTEVTTDMNTGVGGGTAPPPADTTPPTVALSAPAAGATVSGTTKVTATASDDVGVQSVQFKLGAQDLGAADTTSPYSYDWDTKGVANGTYTLTAIARDAAGNAKTSTAVQVTVANSTPVPTGLVGAWSFDDGSGTTAADRSGNGNNGTLKGATWTTSGRYGGALSFNGTSDWVTVPDSNSLDLTGPMTLEAWIKPRALTAWNTVLMKEYGTYYSYALYATDDSLVPTGWARDAVAWGNGPVSTTAWTHLAFTYDGTVAKLYVNGVMTSSSSNVFALPNTNGPLRIGGNGIWGEYFNGLIDDVRVYSRPLSPAEVTADMGTGVSAAAQPSASVPASLRAKLSVSAPDVAAAVANPAVSVRCTVVRHGRHGTKRVCRKR
ncbi:MAG: hypothetical protein QOE63_1910, partial [Acidimicrobiaceae bacterium]